MPHLASTFQEFLRNYGPLIRSEFSGAYDMWPSMIPSLFNRQNTQNTLEKVGGSTPLGLLGVFKGQENVVQSEPLWTKTREFTEFDASVYLERKLIDDVNVPEVLRRIINLADAARTSQEVFAAELFNEADQTTFTYDNTSFNNTTPDGLALASNSHLYSPSDATVQDNLSTSAFSDTALSAAITAMKKFRDSMGQPMVVRPDTLIVGPHLEMTAKQILPAVQVAGNANNDSNPLNPDKGQWSVWPGGMRLLVWNFLDGTSAATTPWYLIDSTLAARSLFWFDRIAPDLSPAQEKDNHQIKYGVYARWGVLASDWRWLYANIP